MIENSLLKTNFLGKDGFRWWIGQVAPEDAQGDQINQIGNTWGSRVKVRIYGYHPPNETELSNKDLYSTEKESAYYYSGGWHIKGLYSLILGFIFSASTIWNTNLMFLQSYAWIIGAFVAWMTYYLLAKK